MWRESTISVVRTPVEVLNPIRGLRSRDIAHLQRAAFSGRGDHIVAKATLGSVVCQLTVSG